MNRKTPIHTDPTQGQLTRGQRKKILRLRKASSNVSADFIRLQSRLSRNSNQY